MQQAFDLVSLKCNVDKLDIDKLKKDLKMKIDQLDVDNCRC